METNLKSYLTINFIKARLAEASTYRGITIVAGALGYTFAPGLLEAILGAVGAVLGAIEVVRKEVK